MALLNIVASVGYYQRNILNSFFNKNLMGVARIWFNQSSTYLALEERGPELDSSNTSNKAPFMVAIFVIAMLRR